MDAGFVCASDGSRQEDYRWNLWADGGANLIAERRRRGAHMPSPYLRETHGMLALSKHAHQGHPAGGAGLKFALGELVF